MTITLEHFVNALIYCLLIWPAFLIIFKKAGLSWLWSLLALIPYAGLISCCGILAHRRWTTVPKLVLKKRDKSERPPL